MIVSGSMIQVAVLAAAIFVPGTEAMSAATHCSSQETAVFSCMVGKKIVSLCRSDDLPGAAGSLQYRFGRRGAVELSYPEEPSDPRTAFTGGLTLYGNGGTSYVHFVTEGIAYTVYSDIGIGREEEGLVVNRGGEILAAMRCKDTTRDDTWWLQIDKGALPREPQGFMPPVSGGG